MIEDTASVREATRADMPATAAALAEAFADDPYHRFMFPDERRRERRFEQSFRVYLRTWQGRSTTLVAPGAGCAIWVPPGGWSLPAGAAARELAALAPVYGLRRIVPNVRSWMRVEARHPRQPPHWYLYILGVAPDHQGRGLGSALMAPVLEECDRDGLPSYLETAKERNVDFYGRHGYAVCDEVLQPGVPKIWCLWREPR